HLFARPSVARDSSGRGPDDYHALRECDERQAPGCPPSLLCPGFSSSLLSRSAVRLPGHFFRPRTGGDVAGNGRVLSIAFPCRHRFRGDPLRVWLCRLVARRPAMARDLAARISPGIGPDAGIDVTPLRPGTHET